MSKSTRRFRRHRSISPFVKRRAGPKGFAAELLEQRMLLTALTSAYPIPNSHAASLSADISAAFAHDINPTSATPQTFVVHSGQRGQLAGQAASVSVAGDTVTLDPASSFLPGEFVQVTATSGLEGTGGESTAPYVWQFRAQVNGGSGVFDSVQSLGIGGSQDVELGDLDGDGDLDAFIANKGGNRVLLNNGELFIDSGQTLGDSFTYAVALGDVDGDGDLDAFVANGDFAEPSQTNHVWLNNGIGQFSISGQDLGAHNSRDVALGDLDGDGDLDAFVVNGDTFDQAHSDRLWLNDGGGQFTDSAQDLGSYDGRGVSLGDLDGDGDLDAFVVNREPITAGPHPGNRVWLNDAGQLTDSGQQLGFHNVRGVALGDLDGDGDLDAFVANLDAANHVWLNNGGQFSDSGQGLGDYTSRHVSLGDLDGDGDLDAFVANSSGGNRVWSNNGDGEFSDSNQLLGLNAGSDASLGDVDGDGDLDAFVASISEGGNRVWSNLDPSQVPALLAADNFESGDFFGGLEEWSTGQWSVAGDATISTASPLGSFEARLRRSTGDLIRSVDTSAFSDAKLTFAARLNSFESTDKAWIKTSSDGSNWTTVLELGDGQDDNQYHIYEIDITSPPDTLYVRFDAGMSNHKDYWYIDDVRVTGSQEASLSQPPVITSTPISAAMEDASYTYTVVASDPDVGDTLTYSLDTAPNGMNIDSVTGAIAWTPSNDHVGVNPVTVRVEDQTGAFSTQHFDVSVANVNDAPTIQSTAVTTATVDVGYTYHVVAIDPDLGDSLSFSLNVAPPGMTINGGTGQIQWTPASAGTYPVSVLVEDAASESDSQTFSVVVSEAPAVVTYWKDEVPDLAIPDNGVTNSTLAVSDSFVIANVTLNVNIDHSRPGDLRLSLIHGSTAVELSDIGGGSISAFNGDDVNGDWTLEIRDVKRRKTGVLEDWALTVDGIPTAAGLSNSVPLSLMQLHATIQRTPAEDDTSPRHRDRRPQLRSDFTSEALRAAVDSDTMESPLESGAASENGPSRLSFSEAVDELFSNPALLLES